jgi:hypothetical protein
MRKEILILAAGLLAAPLGWAATPLIVCPPASTLECSNAAATVVETMVSDADGDALMVVWMVNGQSVLTNVVEAGVTTNGVTLSLSYPFTLGTNEVLVGVTDDGTNVVSCSTLITVADTTPPVIDLVAVTPNSLWPPNHKFRDIRVRVEAHDDCGGPVSWQIMSVESNEPVDGRGDGNTAPDWLIEGNKVKVRSERSGSGIGRVYTIHVQASDGSTNAAVSSVKVYVAHDRGHGKPYHDPADDEDDGPPGKGKGKDKGNGNGNGKGHGKK